MKQFLASTIVNGNEIKLVKENGGYFIHWGEHDKTKAIQELLTPSGRKPSQSSAHKKFLKAVSILKYFIFKQ
jgi:hypothetical protein